LAKRLTELKAEFYALSFATGATKNDSAIDIDGGISTLFVYASKGSKELPDGRVYGTTSVSLVALGAHALRYDFQPVPADPTTWYPVDLQAR